MSSIIPSGMVLPDGQLNTSFFQGNYTAGYNFLQDILNFDPFNPTNQYYGNIYWVVVGCVIAWLTVINFSLTYLSITLKSIAGGLFVTPWTFVCGIIDRQKFQNIFSIRYILIIILYAALILCLTFVDAWTAGFQQYVSIGFRAGWIAVAQLPLVVLLAGKKNIIGYLTGTSYVQLNYLHRWVARMVFFCSTIHMIFMYRNFEEFGFTSMEWNTDTCPPTGTAAWVILCWIVFSSISPVRNWRYEIFVAQHIISYIGFIIAVIIHIQPYPKTIWVYTYITCGIILLDWLIRIPFFLRGISKARLYKASNDITLVTIIAPHMSSWKPGQFIRLSIPKIGIFQFHPFTIANLPNAEHELKLVCKRKDGFTKKLLEYAENSANKNLVSFVDGPYGDLSKLQIYENLVIVIGGSAISFGLPFFLEFASDLKLASNTKRINLIWIEKNIDHLKLVLNDLTLMSNSNFIGGKIDVFITAGELGDEEKSPISKNYPEFLTVQYGRPQLANVVPSSVLNGETAFAVAGPESLQIEVRNFVSAQNLLRSQHGSISSIYLHVEQYKY